MARQKGCIALTGKWGKQIGFRRNGKYFVRSVPEKVHQTLPTIHAAVRFGSYSRKAKLIRHAIYQEMDVRCDTSHVNRLNRILINATGNHGAVKGFRFNQDAGIDRFLTLSPGLSKDEVLHIPAQDIIQYRNITALEIKAIAVRIDFNTNQVTGTDTVTIMIDPQTPFAGATIPLYIPGNGTVLLTLQIRGILGDSPSCSTQCQAADIIAVVAPPVPKRFKMHTHPLQTIALPESELGHPLTPHHPHLVQRE